MTTWKDIIDKVIKPIGILGFLAAAAWVVNWFISDSNRNHDVDQRIFPTSVDLKETLENNAAKPSEKEVYIMNQEALKIKKEAVIYQKQTVEQGDSLLKLAEYFKDSKQQIDSFFIMKDKYDERDSITEKKKEESRAGRDATNRKILANDEKIFKLLEEINKKKNN